MSKLEMTNAKLGPAHLPRAPEIRQNLQVSKHFCALAFGPLVVVWGTAASRARVLQGRARAADVLASTSSALGPRNAPP